MRRPVAFEGLIWFLMPSLTGLIFTKAMCPVCLLTLLKRNHRHTLLACCSVRMCVCMRRVAQGGKKSSCKVGIVWEDADVLY